MFFETFLSHLSIFIFLIFLTTLSSLFFLLFFLPHMSSYDILGQNSCESDGTLLESNAQVSDNHRMHLVVVVVGF
jgi:hypothetical protein